MELGQWPEFLPRKTELVVPMAVDPVDGRILLDTGKALGYYDTRSRSLEHSHRIRGRCLVPRPGNAVPIRGSGSKRVGVPFKVGSRPNLRRVAAPLLADLIGIRMLSIADWGDFC